MRAYEFIKESVDYNNLTIPAEPGTAPIKPGYIRLYHQTTVDNLMKIKQTGITIANAKGIEGPRAIYAGTSGFYGSPTEHPTVEFQISKNMCDPPFVLQDVPVENIIGGHLPWHNHARYIEEDPELIKEVLDGRFDNLNDTGYIPAIHFIKEKYS